MKKVTLSDLIEHYDGFLLDAYGVLVDSDRTLPGASRLLGELRRRKKPFRLISNDGSTTPEAKVAKWSDRGLQIEVQELLTPWNVLADDAGPISLRERGCLVLGTPLSVEMMMRAGGFPVNAAEELDVLIVADELTGDFMKTADHCLSLFVRAVHLGREPALVLVNPDLVYPSSTGYGFTAGAIALMFEAALERILGERRSFVSVGKPGPELFQLGVRSMGLERRRVVMLGDQWETDIAGARAAGVDSVLVGGGIGTAGGRDEQQAYLPGLSP